jgi:hypothetical protein
VAARNIFICYRRDDSAGDAGRLFDRLNERFPGRVFMDVAGISLATRWAEAIEKSLRDCAVVIVIIGKRWLDAGPDGTRRIDNADDPIRREVVTAMRLGIALVPLAVSGAAIPDRKLLPAEFASLVDWQAHRIDHDDFDHDASRLVRQLEHALGEPAHETVGGTDTPPLANVARGLIGASAGRAAKVGWFGLTLGSLKLWVTVGMAALAFVVVGVGGMLQSNVRSEPAVSAPAAAAPPPAAADEPSPSPAGTAPKPKGTTGSGAVANAPPKQDATRLAGEYSLASYSLNGVPMALRGMLSLGPDGTGAYEFDMQFRDSAGALLAYTGMLQRQGASWVTTVVRSNDPSAVYTPVPTRLSIDGSQLRVRNALGQEAVWQRR